MRQRTLGVFVLLACLMAAPVIAQEKPAATATPAVAEKPSPPAMTEVQKLTLLNFAKDIELAQLKAQAAQDAFTRAQGEIQKLLQSLQVEGYTLDLQTMTYTKKPAEPAPAPGTPAAPAKPKGGGPPQ